MKNRSIINIIKRHVLIVEDEIINQEILKEILSEQYDVEVANNGLEALRYIDSCLTPISLILLDINMPVMNGLEFLKRIKADEKHKKIPVIVLTAETQSELDSLKLGAVDYIKKPYDMPEIVLARVKRSIELSEDRNIIQAAERDPLTGVYNTHIFLEYMSKMDEYHTSELNEVIVVSLTKFHFYKELNGEEKANELLRQFGDVCKHIARKYDGIVGITFRNRFVLYLKHIEDYDSFVKEIDDLLNKEYGYDHISYFLGIYCVSDKKENTQLRVDKAVLACEKRESDYQNKYHVFDEKTKADEVYKERLVSDFSHALANDEFVILYQPKVDITGDFPRLAGGEALVRWKHSKLGFISPGMFIPLFESNGMIRELDFYVFQKVVEQIKTWSLKYKTTVPISINVSRMDLFQKGFADKLRDYVNEQGVDIKKIHLEITESAYTKDIDQIVKVTKQLYNYGFSIEIDDFGSGYSALNTLSILDFDVLKLDMQFAREMLSNPKTMIMVKIVAEIAKLLKVKLISEGVEKQEEYEALKKLGYDMIQGYYFSKPIYSDEFETLLKKEQ